MKKFTLTEKILVLVTLLVSLVMAVVLGSVLDTGEPYDDDGDLVELLVDEGHLLPQSLGDVTRAYDNLKFELHY